MKTAKEILLEYVDNDDILQLWQHEVISIMEAYAAQFQDSSPIEGVKPTNYLYEKYKDMPLSQKEGELREALKMLVLAFEGDEDLESYQISRINTAKEVLNPKA